MKALRLKIWQQQLLQTLNKFMKTRIKVVTTNGKTNYIAQSKGLDSGWICLWYLFPIFGQIAFIADIFTYCNMDMYSKCTYNYFTDAEFDTLEECKAFIAYYTINGHVPPSTVTETVDYINYKIIK